MLDGTTKGGTTTAGGRAEKIADKIADKIGYAIAKAVSAGMEINSALHQLDSLRATEVWSIEYRLYETRKSLRRAIGALEYIETTVREALE